MSSGASVASSGAASVVNAGGTLPATEQTGADRPTAPVLTFTLGGHRLRIVEGLDGGCYVVKWRDELERRHGMPHWLVLERIVESPPPP